ncbi:hypothetical protein L218DRAFT_408075 [Marasmius fiardii PR-910]|nr:hypothetical protein L218DRAFT_408075 [Marasmius fiardii PR-910]
MSTSIPSNSTTSGSTHQGWTVFTSQAPTNSQGRAQQLHSQFVPQYAPFSDLPNCPSPPPPEPQARSTSRERGSSRYAPYPHPSPPLSVSVPPSIQHDTRSISPLSPLHQQPHPHIVLPPIGRETGPTSMSGGASYALPPISALEDLRGVDASDSAAVLRRLKGPDQLGDCPRLGTLGGPPARNPGYAASSISSLSWPPPEYHSTQHSLPSIHKLPSDPSMRSHHSLRSYNSRDSFQSGRLSVSVPSDSSCAPSPISPPSPSTPATPLSVASMVSAFGRESMTKDSRQEYHYHHSQHPSSDYSRPSLPIDSRRDSYGGESLSRRSSQSSDMHLDHSRQPHRPW